MQYTHIWSYDHALCPYMAMYRNSCEALGARCWQKLARIRHHIACWSVTHTYKRGCAVRQAGGVSEAQGEEGSENTSELRFGRMSRCWLFGRSIADFCMNMGY